MVEYSSTTFVHKFQKKICLYLFTELFDKDYLSLVRINSGQLPEEFGLTTEQFRKLYI